MYKYILVAVDESDISKQALQEAISMSKLTQAKLRIAHAVQPVSSGYLAAGIDYEQLELAFKEEAQKLLNQMVDLAQQSGIECDGQVLVMNAQERIPEKILEAAKTWLADLIVMGTHGRQGLEHLMLGSVAEGVIRNATVPVLLIRGKEA